MSYMEFFDIHPRFGQMNRSDRIRRTNVLCHCLVNLSAPESFKRVDTLVVFVEDMETMATFALWSAGERCPMNFEWLPHTEQPRRDRRPWSETFARYVVDHTPTTEFFGLSDPPVPTWAPACHPPRPQQPLVLSPSFVGLFRTHHNPFPGYGDYVVPLPHDQIKAISYNRSKAMIRELDPLWMAIEFSHVTNNGLLGKNNESLLMLRPRNTKRSTAVHLLRMWGLVLAWFHREILLRGQQNDPPRVECPANIVPFEDFLAGLAAANELDSIRIEDQVEGIRGLIDTGVLNVSAVARRR
ncbi:hypothetical protein PpBr36_02240 [Pyricularia pennisetigena]|uniref:hypothetical protein n=1 Tax=Pyricularia pennisetigena TaxID=1578925 RepID=UPI001150E02E|nr:hypothetical protein PpBr36_02240 [Pyricularia pennisetigena]TLS30042.1 hypothetical protein PpBr36_02240 [Pyricularia pennisetigena]